MAVQDESPTGVNTGGRGGGILQVTDLGLEYHTQGFKLVFSFDHDLEMGREVRTAPEASLYEPSELKTSPRSASYAGNHPVVLGLQRVQYRESPGYSVTLAHHILVRKKLLGGVRPPSCLHVTHVVTCIHFRGILGDTI